MKKIVVEVTRMKVQMTLMAIANAVPPAARNIVLSTIHDKLDSFLKVCPETMFRITVEGFNAEPITEG